MWVTGVGEGSFRVKQQVISHLSKTIDAWDGFQTRDMGYFLRLESPTGRAGSLLHTIEKNILDLRVLRQEVEDQKRLMESIEREVSGFTVQSHHWTKRYLPFNRFHNAYNKIATTSPTSSSKAGNI